MVNVEMRMRECHACNAELSSSSKFCDQCGEKVKTEQYCSSCNKKMPLTSKFCDDCGTKLESISAKKQPATPKNKYGNSITNLNIISRNHVTGQGEDVFYTWSSNIYKINKNQIDLIYSDDLRVSSLNVVGNQLYYIGYNRIVSTTTSGGPSTTLFSLSKLSEYTNGNLDKIIVIDNWIFFTLIGSVNSFLGRIRTNGENFQIIYPPSNDNLNDSNCDSISIIDASGEWLYLQLGGRSGKKQIISTDGKKVVHPHQYFDYCNIINQYSDKKMTIEEIKETFDNSITRIDFDNKWLFFEAEGNGYSIDRVSFDGKTRELYWQDAKGEDWAAQTNNPSPNYARGFCRDRYFDELNRVSVGFGNGGPHEYSLFQSQADGKIICLGGNGLDVEGQCLESYNSDMQIVGDWVYWGDGVLHRWRQNINTYEEQMIDLIDLNIRPVE